MFLRGWWLCIIFLISARKISEETENFLKFKIRFSPLINIFDLCRLSVSHIFDFLTIYYYGIRILFSPRRGTESEMFKIVKGPKPTSINYRSAEFLNFFY